MHKPAAQRQLVSQLKDERSKLQDLVWELDDVERAIADSDSDGVQTATAQTKQMIQRRERLEEAVLHQMIHIDHLEQRLENLEYPPINAA